MSNEEYEEEPEDEQESKLGFYHKLKRFVPKLFINLADETPPKTISESYFTLNFNNYIEKFKGKDFENDFLKSIKISGSYDEKMMHKFTDKLIQTKSELLEASIPKITEEPDSTEIISEEKDLKTLIDTNEFLVKRNDELTKEIERLIKNYEELVKENNEKLSRIKELIESKVSISKTPAYWVEEAFNKDIEKEDLE